VLRGQLTELFMGEAHNYRMRISIKRPRAVSTEIFPVTSKRTGGRKTRLWLSYHDWAAAGNIWAVITFFRCYGKVAVRR
jgi:hypothetical protein